MAVAERTAEPLVRDGRIAWGSPLHRLQDVFENPDDGVLVGDLLDTLHACDRTDAIVQKLLALHSNKPKNNRVEVDVLEITHLTQSLLMGS